MRAPRNLTPTHRVSPKSLSSLLLVLSAVLVAGCGGGSERPTEAEWVPEWEQRQQLMPDAATLLAGGRVLCDELDGAMRVALPELLPSPTDVLDDPVKEWNAHAVSIVFECSTDELTIVHQLETLEVLAAEVDGGLGSAKN